ncbi:MAG: ArnT family glycosyltransferase [Candidatus Binatia bacterium]
MLRVGFDPVLARRGEAVKRSEDVERRADETGESGRVRPQRILSDRRVFLALAAISLAVYLPGFTWGIPFATGPQRIHSWGNDDLVPLAPLTEMYQTFVESHPDRNIAYPWFHYFLVAAAYAPYLVLLRLTGGFGSPQAAYPFGLADPVGTFAALTIIGRLVTVVLAVACVLAAYAAATRLWNRTAGAFAALFTLLMYPMAYYARLGNLDVPVLAWTSLGLAASAAVLRDGLSVRRGVWLGVFVAIACATKDQALGSFVLLGPALAWIAVRSAAGERAAGWRALGAAALAFLFTYVLASGIPFDPERYWAHLTKAASAGTHTIYLRYPATPAGFAAQARDLGLYLVDVSGWPLLLAAGAGIALAARSERRPLWLLLSSIGFLALLMPVRFARLHYLLPVALPLTLFAAHAIARGLAGPRPARLTAAGGAALILGQLGLQTLDLTHDMIRDSRYDAGAWLGRHARGGDRVLFFGAPMRNPHLAADVAGIHLEERARVLPTIAAERPDFVLVMPDDTNERRHRVEWRFGPNSIYSDYVPPEVWEGLVDGSLGYRLAAQFQSPRLLPWLERPFLSYPTVNPPVQIFVRSDRLEGAPALEAWRTAPHYPRAVRVRELTIERERDALHDGGRRE